jgi:formylglycine-generating enzyme required for sulfatase activity
MSKFCIHVMAIVLIAAFYSCKDAVSDVTKLPDEPVDTFFGGKAVSEGTPLTAAGIDVSKIPSQVGDPTDPTALAALKNQRAQYILKAVSDMVYVDGGSFLMGATAEQGSDAHIYETPAHKVTLSSFYISKFEVTRKLYWIVMGGSNQAGFMAYDTTMTIPIDNRIYSEMQTFCTKLNDITGLHFTLPTEAQWEFAARGGRKRGVATEYAGSGTTEDVACYWSNSLRLPTGQTTTQRWPMPAGSKSSNALGLYDMSGNMAEVCQDWYAPYDAGDLTDPTGPASPPNSSLQLRVVRGGGWATVASPCRVSARSSFVPTARYNYIGFRLVHPFQ